jgi:hypothetical protein
VAPQRRALPLLLVHTWPQQQDGGLTLRTAPDRCETRTNPARPTVLLPPSPPLRQGGVEARPGAVLLPGRPRPRLRAATELWRAPRAVSRSQGRDRSLSPDEGTSAVGTSGRWWPRPTGRSNAGMPAALFPWSRPSHQLTHHDWRPCPHRVQTVTPGKVRPGPGATWAWWSRVVCPGRTPSSRWRRVTRPAQRLVRTLPDAAARASHRTCRKVG